MYGTRRGAERVTRNCQLRLRGLKIRSAAEREESKRSGSVSVALGMHLEVARMFSRLVRIIELSPVVHGRLQPAERIYARPQ